MRILIGADLVPTKSNEELFKIGAAVDLVGSGLCELLKKADYRIFNMELPLTNTYTPIIKSGPTHIAPTATIEGYKALGTNLVTLANNHIMDQGDQGLFSTIGVLNDNGISFLGAGRNLEQAQKPYLFEISGKKIGIYACAEHEFSIADASTPGANPFDPLESLDHIVEMKKVCDYAIVLYHGGKEHYRYPSMNLQKVCRKIVEKGADLVLCQHSHCIGCEEKYKSATIVYGQGNFLFDEDENELWQTSLLVQVGDNFEISYIPLVKKGNGVRLADSKQRKEILDDFYTRSLELTREGVVEKKYEEYVEKQSLYYLFTLSGMRRGFIYKAFNKLSGYQLDSYILKKKYGGKNGLAVINFFECEAHRELITVLLKISKKFL